MADRGLVAVQSLDADGATGAAFVTLATFDAPPAVFRLDDDGLRRWCPPPPPSDVVPDLVVEHLAYPSLDGTTIGLFVMRRADVTPSPATPLILTGYGGFALSESPAWMTYLVAWCAAGGVAAVAGLRGGLEHGEAWHDAGEAGEQAARVRRLPQPRRTGWSPTVGRRGSTWRSSDGRTVACWSARR